MRQNVKTTSADKTEYSIRRIFLKLKAQEPAEQIHKVIECSWKEPHVAEHAMIVHKSTVSTWTEDSAT